MNKIILFALSLCLLFVVASEAQAQQTTINFNEHNVQSGRHKIPSNHYSSQGLWMYSFPAPSFGSTVYHNVDITNPSADPSQSCRPNPGGNYAQASDHIAGGWANGLRLVFADSNNANSQRVTSSISFSLGIASGGGPFVVEAFNHTGGLIDRVANVQVAGLPQTHSGNCPVYTVSFNDLNIHEIRIVKTGGPAGDATVGFVIDNIVYNTPTLPEAGAPQNPPGNFSFSVTPSCDGHIPVNTITWTASSGAQSYAANIGGSEYTLPFSGFRYEHRGLNHGQSYRYNLRAENQAGSRAADGNGRSFRALDCRAYVLEISPNNLTGMQRNSTRDLVARVYLRSETGRTQVTGGFTINWSVTNNIGNLSTTSGVNTSFTSAPDCSALDANNRGIITATSTNIGGRTVLPASISVSIIRCGANIVGDIGSGGDVSGINVGSGSIVASGGNISVNGEVVSVPGYDIDYEDFIDSQEDAIDRLISERAVPLPLSAGGCLSGSHNLNPGGVANPSGGLFVHEGNLEICGNVTFSGKGTIIVQGDLIFRGNRRYSLGYSDNASDMLGIIVEGDMIIPSGSNIVGAYLVKGKATIQGM